MVVVVVQLGHPYIGKTFAATYERALVWLVAGMSTPVNCQSTSLDERLVARFVVAGVRPLIRMYSIVALQVGLSIEALLYPPTVSPLLTQLNSVGRG